MAKMEGMGIITLKNIILRRSRRSEEQKQILKTRQIISNFYKIETNEEPWVLSCLGEITVEST